MDDYSLASTEQMNIDTLKINNSLQIAESFIKKSYMNELWSFSALKPRHSINYINYIDNIRLFHIQSIVIGKTENNLDKLNNVYSALHSLGLSVVMMLDGHSDAIELYMGIRSSKSISENTSYENVFKNLFEGNFPGCKLVKINQNEFENRMEEILPADGKNSVTSLTAIPSLKNNKAENQSFVQGLEKLIDTLQDKKYTIMIISDPVPDENIEIIKQGYEELYSELSPLSETELNISKSDSESIGNTDTEGFTNTISNSMSKTRSITKGTSRTLSQSTTNTRGTSFGTSVGLNGSAGVNASSSTTKSFNAGINGSVGIKAIANIGASLTAGLAKTITGGIFGSIGSSIGANSSVFGSHSKTQGEANTDSESIQRGETETRSVSKAYSTQRSQQSSTSSSSSSSLSIKIDNKSIADVLEIIDGHLKRLQECGNYGMWSSAAYFISRSKDTSIIAASTYRGIINGESTNLERPAMNTWSEDENTKNINRYLRKFKHPVFYDPEYIYDPEAFTDITAATMISTKELSLECGIPNRSIPGVSVREMASFGRNIFEENEGKNNNISLGKIYHKGSYESNRPVTLNTDTLCEHAFVTGSTGSGKSNTVYNIIANLSIPKDRKNIPALIIEPSKGEYKQVFGEKFNVYGTNPYYTKLLKINPFKFESGIHVLEHIDRLIDIFNVCWPMYAAMPAVLKEAVEEAYIDAGWDLITSVNKYNPAWYPTFSDVLYSLRKVISNSDYSQEVKDNYTGSLITRVKSLTNGLNGQIFTANELDSKKLFTENTIVDLSRIGSSETKALIMGILIMRLQERRISEGGINRPLRHITVVEEAHNLLKRTSYEQNSEGSNVLGKSVEMISNAIAEMRTYGEGFIIVDQAPGLLDMSAIRNTNTKIILRLPDFSDRELVGKSAGLSDEQIEELAKIPTGVAAVYQNKWIEPVLCKVDYYTSHQKEYVNPSKKIISEKEIRGKIIGYILSDISKEEPKTDVETIKNYLINSSMPSRLKIRINDIIHTKKPQKLSEVYDLVSECIENLEETFYRSVKAKNIEEWNDLLLEHLDFDTDDLSQKCKYNILECIIHEKTAESGRDHEEFKRWMEYMGRRIV